MKREEQAAHHRQGGVNLPEGLRAIVTGQLSKKAGAKARKPLTMVARPIGMAPKK